MLLSRRIQLPVLLFMILSVGYVIKSVHDTQTEVLLLRQAMEKDGRMVSVGNPKHHIYGISLTGSPREVTIIDVPEAENFSPLPTKQNEEPLQKEPLLSKPGSKREEKEEERRKEETSKSTRPAIDQEKKGEEEYSYSEVEKEIPGQSKAQKKESKVKKQEPVEEEYVEEKEVPGEKAPGKRNEDEEDREKEKKEKERGKVKEKEEKRPPAKVQIDPEEREETDAEAEARIKAKTQQGASLADRSYFSPPDPPLPCPLPGPKDEKPLLILGVVFQKAKDELDALIYQNSLTALRALAPAVKAVIFAEEETEWNQKARELGLEVQSEFEFNRYRVPFLRPILSHLEDHFEAPLYGYADENLLFGKDLIDTLWGVLKRHCESPLGSKLLLVGKRRNLKTTLEDKIESVADAFSRVGDFRKLSKTFIREAMDFFFMTKGLFDWKDEESFPDYVVGRPHYNNALVLMAIRIGTTVVDISMTTTAVHQNDIYGEYGSNRKELKHADRKWNLEVDNPMGLVYEDLKNGHTGSAHYYTTTEARKFRVIQTEQPSPSNLYPLRNQ